MRAKYAGTCNRCGNRFAAGDEVNYNRAARVVDACPACAPQAAATDAPPAPTLTLRVRIQRTKYFDQGSGRRIITVTLDGTAPADVPIEAGAPFDLLVTHQGDVDTGDLVEALGRFEWSDRYNCWQFKSSALAPVVGGTDRAVIAFLKRVLPDVGEARAADMLRHFGGREGTLRVIEHEPHRLTEINGITEQRAKAITEAFRKAGALKDAALFLADLQLGDALTAQILDNYAEHTRATLTADPYAALMALHGVGFKRADEVARRMGIRADDPRRCRAAVLHMFHQAEDEGHTWLGKDDLGLPRPPPPPSKFGPPQL